MKYLLVLDNQWIKTNDDGTPYVTLALENDMTIKLIVTPIVKPCFVHPIDPSHAIYLSDGCVDAMVKYEQDQMLKDLVDKMNEDYGLSNGMLSIEEIRKQLGMPIPMKLDNNSVAILKTEEKSDDINDPSSPAFIKSCYNCKHMIDIYTGWCERSKGCNQLSNWEANDGRNT